MFRTRFKQQIVAEFLPPAQPRRVQKVIIWCDGMPSIPHKQPLMEFLAGEGYWVVYPRYRGAWESSGEFLAKSPHEDIAGSRRRGNGAPKRGFVAQLATFIPRGPRSTVNGCVRGGRAAL